LPVDGVARMLVVLPVESKVAPELRASPQPRVVDVWKE